MWGEWMGDDKIILNQNTGCEYCKQGKPICEYSSPRETRAIYIVGGNKLYCQTGYNYMYRMINYCPMCR